MRIAIDVMGGDNAPDAILAGSLDAIGEFSNTDQLVLVGDEAVISSAIEARGLTGDPRLEIEACSQIIEMGESPVTALRNKPDSSMVRMANLCKSRAGSRQVDVILSAGNTGACVAAAQMSMRRLSGVNRPGIAVTIPTFCGPLVICDVGANPEPKPHHLHQYAQMASVYAHKVGRIQEPRVALLSIGDEETKGNTLVKESVKLLRRDPSLHYVGFAEGRDLFSGKADVLITEGFTGNVVIKLAEGLAAGLFKTIAREIYDIDPAMALQFDPVVRNIYKKHDYHEYGGAPLLGVNGTCLICHGSSEARTIIAAIKTAMTHVKMGVNEGIVDAVSKFALVQEGAA